MKLKKLSEDFYDDNKGLVEALDLLDGEWIPDKTRGHGVVQIKFKELTFAIPLRSRIKHDASCLSVGEKGLDFTKALLITKPEYISEESYKIPSKELYQLRVRKHTIAQRFEKYVNRYIKAKKINNKKVLNLPVYKYTTLQNYNEILLSD